MNREVVSQMLDIGRKFVSDRLRPSRTFAVNCFEQKAPPHAPGVKMDPAEKYQMQFGAVIGRGPTPEAAAIAFDKQWYGQ